MVLKVILHPQTIHLKIGVQRRTYPVLHMYIRTVHMYTFSTIFAFNKFAAPLQTEGPVRIQYNCLVPIYVFPEMKLCSLVISKVEL
jgi:hypothetical protein